MNRSWMYRGVLACATSLSLMAAAAASERYQVYFDESDLRSANTAPPHAMTGDWGSLRLTSPSGTGGLQDPEAADGAGPAGVSYFIPSVSGLRVGIGISTAARERAGDPQAGTTEYTRLGPRVRVSRDPTSNWQIGGTLGYSAFEIGANLGDHTDPGCEPGSTCKTNDFWDVGVAVRIGSGAISAGYMASQPRLAGADEAARIDVFSLSAGYRVSPGVDIYGGVDWVDLGVSGDAAASPTDTRFMFGTSVRF